MRYSRNAIFVLDGRSNCNGSRTFADIYFAEASVRLCLINVFTVMRRDINVFRIKFTKFVNDIINLLDAVSFQWRQNLKRKSCTLLLLIKSITFICYYF